MAARVGGPLGAAALIFVVWNAVILLFRLKPFVLPTPQASIAVIFSNWSTLGGLTLQTITETVYGFFIGAAIGFVLAVAMAQLRIVQRLVYPALITSQAVPIVAIAAPLVILFGFGMVPKLILVAEIVFFPVVVNVLDGLAHIEQEVINLTRVLHASSVRAFLLVRLPATLNPLFSGLKIGATYAVTGAVVGEWTASSTSGLGTYLLTANSQLLTTAVYGATLLLTGIGLASFVLVTVAQHLATPWQTRSTARHWSRTARALRKAPERTTEDSLGRSGGVRLPDEPQPGSHELAAYPAHKGARP